MSSLSTKTSIKCRLTANKYRFVKGCVVSLILILTPFLFYLYLFAPDDSKVWETSFFTITSGGFYNVQAFIHATFTKVTFIIITSLWFFTTTKWWRFAILVPFTMFLFQLSGVLNFAIEYIDEFDFWLSLPVILPIVILMILISLRLNRDIEKIDLKEKIENELKNFRSQ